MTGLIYIEQELKECSKMYRFTKKMKTKRGLKD